MDPEHVLRQYFAALDARDLARVEALLAEWLVFETPIEPLGKEDLLEFLAVLFVAFPYWRFNHEQFVTTGNSVRTKLRMRGTHTATFAAPLPGLRPVPATGRYVVLPEQEFLYETAEGTITRIATAFVPGGGILGLLEQLGVALPPLWWMRLVARGSRLFGRPSRTRGLVRAGGARPGDAKWTR